MAILTKNETPAKGQRAEFQLNKADLADLVTDPYFQVTDNWQSVEMVYKSSIGGQRRVVKFDATQATPIANFFITNKARDIFNIEKIVINDFDGDSIIIYRSALVAAEPGTDFDVDATPAPAGSFLMAENLDFIVQEDGSLIML